MGKPGTPKPSREEGLGPTGTPHAAPARVASPTFGVGTRVETAVCPRCKLENPLPVDFCGRCGFSFNETRSIDSPVLLEPESLIGQVINGKYRVLSLLGEGGFGVVYKVELLLFDTANIFALKLLHPSLSQDKTFRRRFLREAGLAMALIHENTVQIREFGQTEDGQLFFTMDYCAGEPLKSAIAREGFLNVNRALHISRQVLQVMKLAHSRGIIHRDLKPENIFLERDAEGHDFVKVGDFGLAKSFGRDDDSSTAKRLRGARGPSPSEDISRGAILGTPRYMSPEQALGRDDLDDRSDLYSIGVILYEMIFGKVPSERGVTDPDGIEPGTPLPQPGHQVPDAVWQVVRKALEVPRERRYGNADEFLAALAALPKYTPAYAELFTRPARRISALWRNLLLGSAGVLIALGGGAYIEHRGWLPRPSWLKSIRGESSAIAIPLVKRAQVSAETNAEGVPRPAAGNEEGPEALRAVLARGGIRAIFPFRQHTELRYQTFRNGIPDREVNYQIGGEDDSGSRLHVLVGDRKFDWVVDVEKNTLKQEFKILDPKTGTLSTERSVTCLALPKMNDIIGTSYTQDRVLGLQTTPIDLKGLPDDLRLKFRQFEHCFRVVSREDENMRYEYYQEGRGLVAIEVIDSRESQGDDRKPKFARYLIGITRAEEGRVESPESPQSPESPESPSGK